MSRRKKPAATPITDANASISIAQNTDPGAPTAVHEVEMFKKLLKAEKQKVGLQQETIEILKLDKAFLQEQLAKKEDLIQELMNKTPDALDTGAKPPKKERKAPQICISDESFEETDGRESSDLSDSSEGAIELRSKKRQVKRKKPSRSQKGEKSPAPRDVPDHSRVRMKNTTGILSRYMKALEVFKEGNSMKRAFDAVGVDRSTIARTSAIVELKIAAPDVFKALPPWNDRTEKLSTFVDRCRSAMTPEIKQKIIKVKSENELLPFTTTL